MLAKKTIKKNLFVLLILILAIGLSACGAKDEPTLETADVVINYNPVVSATGKVVPADWATLSVPVSGLIVDISVEETDVVSQGDILLTLSGEDAMTAALTATQLELISAQQALDALYENAPLSQAAALQAIANARDAVRDAEQRVNNLINNSPQVDIDQAKANLVLLEDKLEKAKDDFEPYEDKPEDNLTRATFQSKLAQVQREYDAAVRLVNNLTGEANEIDLDQAKADLAFAQAQLQIATNDYADMQDGPDPDDLALAEARLENAVAQVEATQTALDDLTLEAPFNGTVASIYVRENEWVNTSQSVMVLGDMNQLQIETTDLSEIDVAQIKVGSTAEVSFDALPEVTVSATVVRISPKAAEGTGVNYTVILEMDEIPQGLLWDMTAFVDIDIQE